MSDFSTFTDTSDLNFLDESLFQPSEASIQSKNDGDKAGNELPGANQRILSYLATIGTESSAFENLATVSNHSRPRQRQRRPMNVAVEQYEQQEVAEENKQLQQRKILYFLTLAVVAIISAIVYIFYPEYIPNLPALMNFI